MILRYIESLLILTIFSGACNSDSPILELDASLLSIPIIGGERVVGYPAVGALFFNDILLCTGSLIGPRKVLTAAHCLMSVTPEELSFLVGPSMYQPHRISGVQSISIHPDFDYGTRRNDIGIVTLLETASVTPLSINREPMNASWIGRKLLFIGYGVMIENNEYVNEGYKRAVEMEVLTLREQTFLYGDMGKNTCSGDSGGPAIDVTGENSVVVGITSNGDSLCKFYGVNARVDTYLEFIDDQSVDL